MIKGRQWWKLWSSVALGAIAQPLPAFALCPAELPAAIAQIADRPELDRARLGIQVETLAGERLFSLDGDRFFVPASTLKLLTTAAVLTELGPDHTFRTSVLGTFNSADTATLQVLGAGDPSFDQSDLSALSQQLAQQGIHGVDTLYGNDSAFSGEAVNPNWEWEDVQAGYGAPVNALILNENEIGLTLYPQSVGEPLRVAWDSPITGTEWVVENYSTTVTPEMSEFVSVGRALGRPVLRVWGQLIAGAAPEPAAIAEPNPGQAFLNAFQQTLAAEQGIRVEQTQLAVPTHDADWQALAAVESPRLAELLVPTNQDSNNLYAEALLKTLGRQGLDNTATTDTTAAGIAIALQSLQSLGLDPQAVVMVDGSGLARKNLITPAAMVDVLLGMARSPHAQVYQNSLAIAGVSGTLRNRLQETSAVGRLYAKSGAISRNFALAGYLESDTYAPLAFSIFLNNINERGRVARSIIDEIVLKLTALERCPLTDVN